MGVLLLLLSVASLEVDQLAVPAAVSATGAVVGAIVGVTVTGGAVAASFAARDPDAAPGSEQVAFNVATGFLIVVGAPLFAVVGAGAGGAFSLGLVAALGGGFGSVVGVGVGALLGLVFIPPGREVDAFTAVSGVVLRGGIVAGLGAVGAAVGVVGAGLAFEPAEQ